MNGGCRSRPILCYIEGLIGSLSLSLDKGRPTCHVTDELPLRPSIFNLQFDHLLVSHWTDRRTQHSTYSIFLHVISSLTLSAVFIESWMKFSWNLEGRS